MQGLVHPYNLHARLATHPVNPIHSQCSSCTYELCPTDFHYVQINSSKKKTGVLSPKKFVERLKKDNELFRSYMHQVCEGRGPGVSTEAAVLSGSEPGGGEENIQTLDLIL